MIYIFSKDSCPNCLVAQKLADLKNIDHQVMKLGVDFSMETIGDFFSDDAVLPKSFPIIGEFVIGDGGPLGRLIGGLNEFRNYVMKGV